MTIPDPSGVHLATEPLERAEFLSRPNRFVLRCRLRSGKEVTAYLANPGRLGEILLPGVDVLLAPRPGSVHGREVLGAAWESRWPGDRPRAVFLNAARANSLAGRLLEAGLIPELAGWEVERREWTEGGSRFDFLLLRRGRRFLLEVKSVTLAERGLALFPDARTERGRRHIGELAGRRPSAGKRGERAGVLFLVQGDAERFLPDFHNDLDFARAFRSARSRVEMLPYCLSPALAPDGRLVFSGAPRRLEVPEPLLEAGVRDGGLYLLILELPEGAVVEVGGLGLRRFPRGSYVYVGSARRGLTARMDRHLRRRKRFHWHIDHLRDRCGAARALPIRAPAVGECDLAEEVRRIAEEEIAGFGCSDCDCRSHLFRFEAPPYRTAPFQEMLTRLRHSSSISSPPTGRRSGSRPAGSSARHPPAPGSTGR